MPHSAITLCSSTWRSLSGAMTELLVKGGVVRSSCRSSDSARARRSRLRVSRSWGLTGAGAVIVTRASLGGRSVRRGASDQAALTRPRVDLALRVGDLAPQQRHRWPARDLPSFEWVVVAGGVHLARADRALPLRIEDDDVGVTTERDLALAAEPRDPRRRRREHIDHALDGEPSATHSFRIEHRQQRLEIRHARRNAIEREIRRELRRAAVRVVIGADGVEQADAQRGPDGVDVLTLSQRRLPHPERRVGTLEPLAREVEVQGPRLAVDVEA